MQVQAAITESLTAVGTALVSAKKIGNFAPSVDEESLDSFITRGSFFSFGFDELPVTSTVSNCGSWVDITYWAALYVSLGGRKTGQSAREQAAYKLAGEVQTELHKAGHKFLEAVPSEVTIGEKNINFLSQRWTLRGSFFEPLSEERPVGHIRGFTIEVPLSSEVVTPVTPSEGRVFSEHFSLQFA